MHVVLEVIGAIVLCVGASYGMIWLYKNFVDMLFDIDYPDVYVDTTEFIANPGPWFAFVRAGHKLIVTDKDGNPGMTVLPGTIADYGTEE